MDDITTPQPSHEPLPVNIGLSEQHRKQLAEGLQGVLADSYTLLGKTHGFHWNVVGPQFHSLHEMFEEQYQDLQDAVDDIAERIRALGFLAPGSLSQFLKLTTIKDEHEAPKAQDMLRELVEDNETVARACRGVVRICHEADDTVTEDLMNQRLRAHEKAAWMLRASLRQ
jgi:starvation-inducible DNA-binding protein